MAAQKDYLMRAAYQWVVSQESPRKVPWIGGLILPENPDISGWAGLDLVRFLRAIYSLDPLVRQRLHLIQLGDLFELWIGKLYHLVPGPDGVPRWRYPDSPQTVADWCLEVMIQNAPVFSWLDRLKGAGLAEMKFLGGNHDGYLMKDDVATLLALPTREPFYRGLHGDMLVEHGHRFDSANHDNVNGKNPFKGPIVTMLLIGAPKLRELETPVGIASELWTPESRDGCLLGATLVYLHERMELQQKPFSIYVMAHTHRRMLTRFDIRTKYTTTNHEEGIRGEARP
jgi:UDP-2,3-diacylglucosamine pyrophosphatase LpxH